MFCVFFGTSKNIKNHETPLKPSKTIKNHQKASKHIKNHQKPSKNHQKPVVYIKTP